MKKLLLLGLISSVSALADINVGSYSVQPGSDVDMQACVCNLPSGEQQSGITLFWTVNKVQVGSGFHYHESLVTPRTENLQLVTSHCTTNQTGCCSIEALVPFYAGQYSVHITSNGLTENEADIYVLAQYPGLMTGDIPLVQWLANPGHDNLVTYLDPYERTQLGVIASHYGKVVTVLWASLPWGGDLDRNNDFTPSPTDPHMYGKAFDLAIPGNSADQVKLIAAIAWAKKITGGPCQSVAYPGYWHVQCE